jgi:O-antigen/teichoic acid export membrane protein
VALWSALPAGRAPRFELGSLRKLQRFAASLTAVTALSLVLMYLDKLVASSLFPLEVFGRYTLSWTVANGLLVVTMPVFNALSPRLTALMAAGETAAVRETYTTTAQLLGVALGSLAAVVGWFSEPVILIWTGDAALARHAAPVVRLLVAGTALNGILYMPYALQLATAWTRPALISCSAFVIVLVPATVVATRRYGAAGPAAVWLTLNLCSLLTVAPIVHRRVLPGQGWRWLRAWLTPAAAAFVVAGALRNGVQVPPGRIGGAGALGAVMLVCGLAATLATPLGRQRLRGLRRRVGADDGAGR